jgi:hypothetical protein
MFGLLKVKTGILRNVTKGLSQAAFSELLDAFKEIFLITGTTVNF